MEAGMLRCLEAKTWLKTYLINKIILTKNISKKLFYMNDIIDNDV